MTYNTKKYRIYDVEYTYHGKSYKQWIKAGSESQARSFFYIDFYDRYFLGSYRVEDKSKIMEDIKKDITIERISFHFKYA